MSANESTDDPPFHFEIYRGPSEEFGEEPKAIYYVENHNGQCGYSDLATDFEMAAEAIIDVYRETQLGNWMAPCAHLVRQTLELRVKALLSSIGDRDSSVNLALLKTHALMGIWGESLQWLVSNKFEIAQDNRLHRTEHLLRSFDAIDPTGDLFRFGISRKAAFGKQKSYDRVGLVLSVLSDDFKSATGLLSHWNAVVFRMTIAEEEGWLKDELFDADNFPHIPDAQS